MNRSARHYLIFETAHGFCGIAWNTTGTIRFRLPARTAEATERSLLRRLAGAEPGAPTPEVIQTVAAARRYFDGEKMDFSDVQLDLDEQDEFFREIYGAARQVGWGRTTTYGTLARELGRVELEGVHLGPPLQQHSLDL